MQENDKLAVFSKLQSFCLKITEKSNTLTPVPRVIRYEERPIMRLITLETQRLRGMKCNKCLRH